MKGILALQRQLPSEKKRSITFSYQNLERAKCRDTCPSLNVIHTGSKNGRSPNAPYDQTCTEWNEEQEELARHRAYKLHKELNKTKGHCKDVHKKKFFSSWVP